MIHGLVDPIWLECFPSEALPNVLAYVSQSWKNLLSKYPQKHTYKAREEKLTASLAEYMNDPEGRKKHGVSGRFVPEVWSNERQPDGTLKKVGRSDINYFHGVGGSPELTIEFKKLNNSRTKRAYYCYEGIKRFVDGKYAKDQRIGTMCGLVKENIANEIAAMVNFLLDSNHVNALRCEKTPKGTIVGTPSNLAPRVAAFDTRHRRPTHGNSLIDLAHMFLEF